VRRLAVLLGALALAGCGGSKSTSTSSTATVAPTASTTSARAPTTTRTTRTHPRTTHTTTPAKTTATGGVNVRVPARFTIRADGSVTPPTVTIPADLPVELIVVSNRRPHRIALRATTLTVRPHAQAEALIDGLAAGSYPLEVDGVPKAVLRIGGNPGP
jgi:hypothetical protein